MNSYARWDVLGIGVVTVDDLYYVEHYPEPDTKMRVASYQRQGGGLTGTALVAAARLGSTAAFAAILGEDDLSQFTLRELEREGIDCSTVVRRPGARPFHSFIIVEQGTGRRSILYTDEGVVLPGPEEVTADMVTACRVLLIDHHGARTAMHAVDLAQANGIPVVADVEGLATEAARELLERADHLIVSRALAHQATGEEEPADMLAALARPGGRACCAVTAGDQGCWYSENGGEVRHCPAIEARVVDTTGCGDVFHGAYAATLAAGESVTQAIRIASIAAGLKAAQPGGRAGIPGWPVVNEYLREAS